MSDEETRSLEATIEIRATPEAVWKALTEPEELTRWLPLVARVEPGEGGSVWMSWNPEDGGARVDEPPVESAARIRVWREGERLVYSYRMPGPDGEFATLTQDFVIERDGGTTRVRLVHSGFGADDAWDDLYDGTRRGWRFELAGLKHYLERHAGTPREVVHVQRDVDGSLAQAWQRLAGADGLAPDRALETVRAGETVVLRPTELLLDVRVTILAPPLDLAGLVTSLDDAYLRVRLDDSCFRPGVRELNLWLSTYGLDAVRRERARRAFEQAAERLFPAAH